MTRPVFIVGVDVFARLSYYCHVTLIGLRFRQVQSSFATFVVAPTQRGHTIVHGLIGAVACSVSVIRKLLLKYCGTWIVMFVF